MTRLEWHCDTCGRTARTGFIRERPDLDHPCLSLLDDSHVCQGFVSLRRVMGETEKELRKFRWGEDTPSLLLGTYASVIYEDAARSLGFTMSLPFEFMEDVASEAIEAAIELHEKGVVP